MTCKIQKTAIMLTMTFMTAATPVWAVNDYSSMSTEELSNSRGTLQEASEEERNAFRSEWQERMQNMTPEERQQYTGQPANAKRDDSSTQQRRGSGGGGRKR